MKTSKAPGASQRRPAPKLRARKTRKKNPISRKSRPLTWKQWLRQSFYESTPADWIPAAYLDMVQRRTQKKRKPTLH